MCVSCAVPIQLPLPETPAEPVRVLTGNRCSLAVVYFTGNLWTEAFAQVWIWGKHRRFCGSLGHPSPTPRGTGTKMGSYWKSGSTPTFVGPGQENKRRTNHVSKYLKVVKLTNCSVEYILSVDLGTYTFMTIWKTKFEYRSFQMLRVLCRNMAERNAWALVLVTAHPYLFLPLQVARLIHVGTPAPTPVLCPEPTTHILYTLWPTLRPGERRRMGEMRCRHTMERQAQV